MKFTNPFLLSVFLAFLLPSLLWAQQPASPPLKAEVNKAEEEDEETSFSWKPSAARIGLDVSRLVVQVVEPGVRFYEVNGDLQFGRYFLAADFGTGKQLWETDGLDYQTSGSYFRLGADVNFIPENKEGNLLYVGLRYAHSNYTEQLSTTLVDPLFGSLPIALDRQASGRWLEGVAGMKARVWKQLFLGYTLRYKFGLKTQDTGTYASYAVPGFGKVGEGNAFSFNYHIFYRIPF